MPTILCALAPFLLGFALAVPLCWWLHRRHLDAPVDRDKFEHLHILWLTLTCEQALGDYAKPGRLRNTPVQCIGKLLNERLPNSQPSVNQYSTWPKQAELLCSGQYENLRIYQKELLYTHGDAPVPRDQWEIEPVWVWAFISALMLSGILFMLSSHYNWCGSVCPPCPPIVSTPRPQNIIELDTDLLFEYNEAKPYTEEHVKDFEQNLKRKFDGHSEIEVTRIKAHTDPIGSDKFNQALAFKRAEYVLMKINELADSSDMRDRFRVKKTPITILDEKPMSNQDEDRRNDRRYWNACFKNFFDPLIPPLENLEPSLAAGRPPCSKTVGQVEDGKLYPACRRLMPNDVGQASARSFFSRAQQFRQLSSCLGPMRHVIVEFSSVALVHNTRSSQ